MKKNIRWMILMIKITKIINNNSNINNNKCLITKMNKEIITKLMKIKK